MSTNSEPSWEPDPSSWPMVGISWLLVGVPLLWGIYKTIEKAKALFVGA